MISFWNCECNISQDAFEKVLRDCHIPPEVRPVRPDKGALIRFPPEGKIGVYTRLFDYVQYRLPLTKFFVGILTHYRINISQLNPLGTAKVSHFEVLCRVCDIEPSVSLFRCFYVKNKKNGWLSFGKRSDNVCYTDVPDSLKNWQECFFLG